MTRADVLGDLGPGEREVVLRTAREVTYDDGARLFDEGGRADRCWLVRQGRVALDTTIPGQGRVVLQTLGPGDLLGWSWLVPPYRWHFGACAVGTVQATELDAEQLRALADRDPRVGYALARQLLVIMLDRLQATRARLLDLYRSPADGR